MNGHRMIRPTCTSCVFFSENLARPDNGQCRAHAPILDKHENGYLRTIWPVVLRSNWCGDHSTFEDGVGAE